MTEECLQMLTPFVASYVETLLRDGKIGLTGGTAKVSDVASGCAITGGGRRLGDRFKLSLPYAGQFVCWETLFNAKYPKEPPDFIFSGDDLHFQPDIEDLKELVDWDCDNSQSLVKVIRELLVHYRQHQLSLLNGTRLQYEYDSLVDGANAPCRPEDVEVLVSMQNGKTRGPVQFAIRLQLELCALPEYLSKDNPGDNAALLQVSYQNLDGGKVTSRLTLSSRLESILSGGGARMPVIPFPVEGCLVDYVHEVQYTIQRCAESVLAGFEKRQELVLAFVALFGSSLVEYSSTEYSRISFLLVWNDFMFLATVSIGPSFPTVQPMLTLQSVYHTKSDGIPFFKTYSSYPYSPRWSGTELAQRTRNFILEAIPEFQKSSVISAV